MADFYGALESTSFRVRNRAKWLADPVVQKLQAKVRAGASIGGSGFLEEEKGWWAFGWYDQYPQPLITELNEATEENDEYDVLDAVQRPYPPGAGRGDVPEGAASNESA